MMGYSTQISALIRDPQFQLQVANLLKPIEKQYTIEQERDIALSQPRLHAVIAAAKSLVTAGIANTFIHALRLMIEGNNPRVVAISNDIAHWTWASTQMLLGKERTLRDAFIDTDLLPPEEVEKDRVRIVATAQLLLDRIS